MRSKLALLAGRCRLAGLLGCALAIALVPVAEAGQAPDPDAPPVVRDGITYRFVRGQVTGGFQLTPVRLADTVQPGEQLEFELTVLNQTGRTQDFTLEAVDLVAGRTGRYSDLQPPGSSPDGAGDWIRLPAEALRLQNLQQATFTVVVEADAKAAAGGHYGAVVVGRTEQAGRDDAVAVENRIVAQVVAMVPGDVRYDVRPARPQVRRAFTTGVPTADIVIDNRGNIHSGAVLSWSWEGRFGDSKVERVELPELLPGGRSEQTIRYADPPLIDIVRPVVTIETEDERTRRVVGDQVYVVRMPVFFGLGGVLLAVVGFLLWRWHRGQRMLELYMLGDEDETDRELQLHEGDAGEVSGS